MWPLTLHRHLRRKQVSAMASVYLQLLIPSLWAFGALNCVAGYLQVHPPQTPAGLMVPQAASIH